MANEGSTKPTYSELEAKIASQKAVINRQQEGLAKNWSAPENQSKRFKGMTNHYTTELSKRDNALKLANKITEHLGVEKFSQALAKIQELEAENLRVRGLLQRAIELLRTVLKASDFYSTTSLKQLIREFVAESADIGKLDSVDENTEGK